MYMRKLFYLALAVMPFAFSACDVEDVEKDGEDAATVTELEGTWYYEDSHHPFTIVFKGETYTFETPGFKDQGTFTYQNNLITCHLTDRWSGDVEWNDGKRVSAGNWEKISLDGYTGRTFKVSLLENGVCIGKLTDEFYGGKPIEIMLLCKGVRISINSSELDGEWLFKENNEVLARLVVDGNNYTIWQEMPYSQQAAATKEHGEWSYENGFINLSPDSMFFSYAHIDTGYVYSRVDPATLEAEEWFQTQYEPDDMKIPAYKSKDTFYISIPDQEYLLKFKKK